MLRGAGVLSRMGPVVGSHCDCFYGTGRFQAFNENGINLLNVVGRITPGGG